MKKMKNKLAVAVTVALLTFPLSTTLTLADTVTPSTSTTVPASTTDTTVSTTTDSAITTTDTTDPTETTVVDADGNTVTPDNWFTELIGKIQLALTFDPARKCELNERHALAKLAKAQELMKEGKPEAAQICLNEYTDKITRAQEFLEQVKDPTSEKAKTLTKALVNVDSNNIQVLSNLLDKLPPQAAQKLALNVVRSMEKAVTKIQKEEAKAVPGTTSETTPDTTSVITPVTDSKTLEKQAKAALKEFKKSLKQKGKIHLEDQEQQDNEDEDVVEQSQPEQEKPEIVQNSQQVTQNQTSQAQSITQSQPTHETVTPVEPQTVTTNRMSEHSKEDRNKQDVHGNDKHSDKQDNHQNDKKH